MQNNNLHKNKAFEFCHEHAPIIILNQPQLGENVGMVARAMLNCGLSDLRLVSPNPHMDMDHAKQSSVKAFHVLDNMKIFNNLTDATQDIHYIYATTARTRDQEKQVLTPDIMARESMDHRENKRKVAYLFGKESVGLANKDVAFANGIVRIPLNPAFSSLNLAQSVLLCAYEWHKLAMNMQEQDPKDKDHKDKDKNTEKHTEKHTEYANKQDMESLYKDVFERLDNTSFFNLQEKRQQKEDQIKNIFNKIPLSKQETQLLRGLFRFINNS